MTKRIRTLRVMAGDSDIGALMKDSQFRFRYEDLVAEHDAVSLAMPVQAREFVRNTIHPVFEMNLPEGYLRQRIVERFRKQATVDEMFFLALQGDRSMGRLGFQSDSVTTDSVEGTSLVDLVETDSPGLFEQLVERYIGQTTIAGIQPKILVPDRNGAKSALPLPDLIVKTAGPEFPQLTINEFVCMSIAQRSGLTVPDFYLSGDKRRFIMRRFDLGSHGRLGMEDLCVLMGLVSDDKYKRSYEQVAKAVSIYSSKPNQDLEILFRSLCISVLVGNGDAHLKNFAMLYDDPVAGKGRLSPAYDIVNTTLYIETDTLALKLGKTKDFPGRTIMSRFGQEHCTLTHKMAESVIDDAIAAVLWGIDNFRDLTEQVEFEGRTLRGELERGVARLMRPEQKHRIWKGEARRPRRSR
jgi:serine/threonine-protein kinase HipA